MYYAIIENGILNGTSELKRIGEDVLNIEISKQMYDKINDSNKENTQIKKYVFKDNEIIENPDYEEQKEQEERKRLDGLSMTRGDVFEALILAQGKTKAELRKFVEEDERLDDITKELYLNRFDEALEFYRGYPIFDLLAEKLDLTTQALDEFFETKDYRKLIPIENEEKNEDEAEKEN